MIITVPVNFNGRIHHITGLGRPLNQEDIDNLAKYGINVSPENYLIEYENDGVKYRGIFPKHLVLKVENEHIQHLRKLYACRISSLWAGPLN